MQTSSGDELNIIGERCMAELLKHHIDTEINLSLNF